MANPQKQKGDRGEREAVEALVLLAGPLGLTMTPLQMRALGAGRKEDTGDIHVFPDVAIQVKNYAAARMNQALREAAVGAEVQAQNGLAPFHLGMSVVPRARKDGFRWAASAVSWPVPVEADAVFSTPTAALEAAKKDPSGLFIARRKGSEDIFVSSLPRWLDDYVTALTVLALSAP